MSLQTTPSTLRRVRKIVTTNIDLPKSLHTTPGVAEPAVGITVEDISPEPQLGGAAARNSVITHPMVPTKANTVDVANLSEFGRVEYHQGVNVQYNDLAPGARVPMHRTTSTDHMFFLIGTVVLITPKAAYDPDTGVGEVNETICQPGDVVVQRGTLHAWENRTNEWARFIGVGVRSEPNSVGIEGDNLRRELADCFLS